VGIQTTWLGGDAGWGYNLRPDFQLLDPQIIMSEKYKFKKIGLGVLGGRG